MRLEQNSIFLQRLPCPTRFLFAESSPAFWQPIRTAVRSLVVADGLVNRDSPSPRRKSAGDNCPLVPPVVSSRESLQIMLANFGQSPRVWLQDPFAFERCVRAHR